MLPSKQPQPLFSSRTSYFKMISVVSVILGGVTLVAPLSNAAAKSPRQSGYELATPSVLSRLDKDASPESPRLSQDSDSPDEETIPTGQVDKYIKVYSAMQKNHSLSVEQATSKQGMTVDEFRTLEDKIERNPVVHQRVLDALKASATGKPVTNSESAD